MATPQEKILKGNILATIRDWVKGKLDSKADASVLTSHTGNTSNPHSVTASQVGLGNVENKSSATIRGEMTSSNVTSALGYTPYNSTNPSGYITNAGTPLTCSLPASGWSSDTITVSCSGISASSNIWVSPAPVSHEEYASCGIYCTAEGANTLTFKRLKANSNALTVNVYLLK